MKRSLRVPAALSFAVVGGLAAASALGCGDDAPPKVDAATTCDVYCVYESTDNGACPFPTCATGSNQDTCPAGCIPEPIA